MAWITTSGGGLHYSGRIDRRPFNEWTQTEEGRQVVRDLAARRGFTLFGKARAARRDLWRELDAATRTPPIARAIQTEVSAYLPLIAQFCYASSAPRSTIALRRLVAIPRALAHVKALERLTKRLQFLPEFTGLQGGPLVREFFFVQLIKEMDSAILAAKPSPARPLPAHEEWVVVGSELEMTWHVPIKREAERPGHFFLYEAPRGGSARADRKEISARMRDLNSLAHGLSRTDRAEVIRKSLHEVR